MSDEQLVFNGIDGDTGRYDLPPMTAEELVKVIRGETTPENIAELRQKDAAEDHRLSGRQGGRPCGEAGTRQAGGSSSPNTR